MRVIPKVLAIREEDYWLVPVGGLVSVFVAIAIYSATVPFRLPSLVLSALGLWFTATKIKSGYGQKHAYTHIILTLGAGVLLFVAVFALTN